MIQTRTSTLRHCETCGAEFKAIAYDINRGKARFCSTACFDLHRKNNRVARFWAKVKKTDTCWLWQGALSRHGYGIFETWPTTSRAHRYSWELHFGSIPEGRVVRHNCPGGDNKSCVRPEHLLLGSPADNSADAVVRGQTPRGDRNGSRRHPEKRAKGERVNTTKLTADQVRTIRTAHAEGISCYRMAKLYGVSQATIQNIVHRKSWAHLL